MICVRRVTWVWFLSGVLARGAVLEFLSGNVRFLDSRRFLQKSSQTSPAKESTDCKDKQKTLRCLLGMLRMQSFPAKTRQVVAPRVLSVAQQHICSVRSMIFDREHFPEWMIWVREVAWDWLSSGGLGWGAVLDFALGNALVLNPRSSCCLAEKKK
jgi:hypothetical protein